MLVTGYFDYMKTSLLPFFVITTLLLLFATYPANGQENDNENWEKWLEALADFSDEDILWDEMHDQLEELAEHPININDTKREILQTIPFLNSQQVMDIVEYIDRYGPLKSKNELLSIESLDYHRRKLLSCFIVIGDKTTDSKITLSKLRKYGKHDIMGYMSIPTYTRRGDNEAYYGYPVKHWLRYNFSYGNKLRLGIVASQDAGEPFFANVNKAGYDYYSPFLMIKDTGIFETIAIGRYKVSLGMGLVINQGFFLGKQSTLMSFASPKGPTIRVHSSRSSDNWLQGAAITLNIAKWLKFTSFASYRKIDATLNNNGTVSTLLSTSYHRTKDEIQRKNNTSMTLAGANLSADKNDYHASISFVATHIDRLLAPNKSSVYRDIYPEGHDFFNASVDYGYRRYPLMVNGETAINREGHIATLNSISFNLSRWLSMTFLQRYYSARYHSFYSNAVNDGGKVQNESGYYLGTEWKPAYDIDVNCYIDYAYFPWPRYQVSQSSHSLDACVSSKMKKGNWIFNARYRYRLRQKDNYDKSSSTPLVWTKSHRARLSVQWDNSIWTAGLQTDACTYSYDHLSKGIMLTQVIGYNMPRLSISATMKLFYTDDYNSRLYSYERAPLYCYSNSAYYGRGLRYSFMAKWKPTDSLTLTGKVGVTDYFDRSSIGSSLQQIDASSACDVELQAKWKW